MLDSKEGAGYDNGKVQDSDSSKNSNEPDLDNFNDVDDLPF